MKIIRTGTFQPDYLYRPFQFNPKENIDAILLKQLNYYIAFLERKIPEALPGYISALTSVFSKLAGDSNGDYPESESLFNLADYPALEKYTDLANATNRYFFSLLDEGQMQEWSAESFEISTNAMIKVWTWPFYYILRTLTETIGREPAISLFKEYVSSYYKDHPSPNQTNFEGLDAMCTKRTSGDTSNSVWVIDHAMLEPGKYAFKNNNCPTCVDAMNELPDSEIKYYTCCYPDYAKFTAMYSDDVILTMEHTIMQGAPYCSRVLHDTRIDYDLRHPPIEFWDAMEEGREDEVEEIYGRFKVD